MPRNDLRNIDLGGCAMRSLMKQLNIVSILEEPFLMHHSFGGENLCRSKKMLCGIPNHNGTSEWIKSCCYGYTVDLIHQLARHLKIKVRLYTVRDNKYGAYNEIIGKFNGMIGKKDNK